MRGKLASALLAAVLAGGCWDAIEVNQRSFVLGLGMDAGPGGEVEISVQIPVVEKLLPSTVAGTQEGKGAFVLTSRGDMPYATVSGLQSMAEKSLFFGQLKAIVISEDLARRGLRPFLGILDRHPSIPPQAVVVLARGRARDILDADLVSGSIPSLALLGFFSVPTAGEQSLKMCKWRLVHALEGGPGDAHLPFVAYDPKARTFLLQGLGVFRGYRLVGELSGDETRLLGILRSQAHDITVRTVTERGTRLAFRSVKARTEFIPRVDGRRVSFLLKARIKGLLIDISEPVSPIGPDTARDFEAAAAKTLALEMTAVVRRLQALRADLLGLGETLAAERPRLWQSLDWEREYPRVPVEVKVDFELNLAGALR